jgi:hypothetical protein
VARSIDSRTSGFGARTARRELSVGLGLLGHALHAEARRRQHRAHRVAARARERREHHARAARARRERLGDVQVDVGLVLLGRDRRDPALRARLVERHAADLAHRVDELRELLVARRHVLRAVAVVELPAVVVRVVVRRRDVEPCGRAEPADRDDSSGVET